MKDCRTICGSVALAGALAGGLALLGSTHRPKRTVHSPSTWCGRQACRPPVRQGLMLM